MSRAARTRSRIVRELRDSGEVHCQLLRWQLSDIDRPTWDRAIRELVERGVVERQGRTNRARYRLAGAAMGRWAVADRDREAARLAQAFHEAYERLAPSFGYETRKASARPWVEVPEPNRKLMEAVCAEVMVPLLASERAAATAACAEVADAVYHREMLAEARAGNRNDADLCRAKMEAAEEIDDAIRALSPADFVGVRREDLDVVHSECHHEEQRRAFEALSPAQRDAFLRGLSR